MLLADDPHVYAFTRTLGDDVLLVLANFTGETQRVDGIDGLAEWADAEVVIGNVDDGPPPASTSCARGRPSCGAGPSGDDDAGGMIR